MAFFRAPNGEYVSYDDAKLTESQIKNHVLNSPRYNPAHPNNQPRPVQVAPRALVVPRAPVQVQQQPAARPAAQQAPVQVPQRPAAQPVAQKPKGKAEGSLSQLITGEVPKHNIFSPETVIGSGREFVANLLPATAAAAKGINELDSGINIFDQLSKLTPEGRAQIAKQDAINKEGYEFARRIGQENKIQNPNIVESSFGFAGGLVPVIASGLAGPSGPMITMAGMGASAAREKNVEMGLEGTTRGNINVVGQTLMGGGLGALSMQGLGVKALSMLPKVGPTIEAALSKVASRIPITPAEWAALQGVDQRIVAQFIRSREIPKAGLDALAATFGRVGANMVAEGAGFAAQTGAANALTKATVDPNISLMEGVDESFLTGAAFAAAHALGVDVYKPIKEKLDAVKKNKQQAIYDEQAYTQQQAREAYESGQGIEVVNPDGSVSIAIAPKAPEPTGKGKKQKTTIDPTVVVPENKVAEVAKDLSNPAADVLTENGKHIDENHPSNYMEGWNDLDPEIKQAHLDIYAGIENIAGLNEKAETTAKAAAPLPAELSLEPSVTSIRDKAVAHAETQGMTPAAKKNFLDGVDGHLDPTKELPAAKGAALKKRMEGIKFAADELAAPIVEAAAPVYEPYRGKFNIEEQPTDLIQNEAPIAELAAEVPEPKGRFTIEEEPAPVLEQAQISPAEIKNNELESLLNSAIDTGDEAAISELKDRGILDENNEVVADHPELVERDNFYKQKLADDNADKVAAGKLPTDTPLEERFTIEGDKFKHQDTENQYQELTKQEPGITREGLRERAFEGMKLAFGDLGADKSAGALASTQKVEIGLSPEDNDVFSSKKNLTEKSSEDSIATELAGKPLALGEGFSASRIFNTLRARLEALGLGDVALRLEYAMWNSDPRDLISGSYNPAKVLVRLAHGIHPRMTEAQIIEAMGRTLDHEVIHALRDLGLISDAEFQILGKEAGIRKPKGSKLTYLEDAHLNYWPKDEFGNDVSWQKMKAEEVSDLLRKIEEEAVANMGSDFAAGDRKINSIQNGLLNRIINGMVKIYRAMKISGADRLMSAIYRGEIGKRERGVSRGGDERKMMVWHGTPHYFRKFDITKIGTGEGNQDFGHGFYLSQTKAGGLHYVRTLARHGRKNLYNVNAPEFDVLLDWDRSFSKSSPDVQRRVLNALSEIIHAPNTSTEIANSVSYIHNSLIQNPDAFTGQEIYQGVSKAFQNTTYNHMTNINRRIAFGNKELSEAFDAAGVPGLKYNDSESRDPATPEEDRTKMLVIFDGRHLSIKEIMPAATSGVMGKKFAEYYKNLKKDADLIKKNKLTVSYMAGGKASDDRTPFTFFHAHHKSDNMTDADKAAYRGFIKNWDTNKSTYGGISLSTDQSWLEGFIGDRNGLTFMPVQILTDKVGDFRNPKDVNAVANYFLKNPKDGSGGPVDGFQSANVGQDYDATPFNSEKTKAKEFLDPDLNFDYRKNNLINYSDYLSYYKTFEANPLYGVNYENYLEAMDDFNKLYGIPGGSDARNLLETFAAKRYEIDRVYERLEAASKELAEKAKSAKLNFAVNELGYKLGELTESGQPVNSAIGAEAVMIANGVVDLYRTQRSIEVYRERLEDDLAELAQDPNANAKYTIEGNEEQIAFYESQLVSMLSYLKGMAYQLKAPNLRPFFNMGGIKKLANPAAELMELSRNFVERLDKQTIDFDADVIDPLKKYKIELIDQKYDAFKNFVNDFNQLKEDFGHPKYHTIIQDLITEKSNASLPIDKQTLEQSYKDYVDKMNQLALGPDLLPNPPDSIPDPFAKEQKINKRKKLFSKFHQYTNEQIEQIDPNLLEEISRGKWRLWEDTNMIKAMGWDAVFMREEIRDNTQDSPINVFVLNDNILPSALRRETGIGRDTFPLGPETDAKVEQMHLEADSRELNSAKKNLPDRAFTKDEIEKFASTRATMLGTMAQMSPGGTLPPTNASTPGFLPGMGGGLTDARIAQQIYESALMADWQINKGMLAKFGNLTSKMGFTDTDTMRLLRTFGTTLFTDQNSLIDLLQRDVLVGNKIKLTLDNTPTLAANVAPQTVHAEHRMVNQKMFPELTRRMSEARDWANVGLDDLNSELKALGHLDNYVNKEISADRPITVVLHEAYAYAKHAVEYNKYGREVLKIEIAKDANGKPIYDKMASGMSDAEANAIMGWVDKLPPDRQKVMKDAHDYLMFVASEQRRSAIENGIGYDFDKIRNNLMATMKKLKIDFKTELDPIKKAEIKKKFDLTATQFKKLPNYKFYVPLKTSLDDLIMDKFGNIANGSRWGAFSGMQNPTGVRGKEYIRRTGRGSYAGEIIPNLFTDYKNTIARGVRNQVGNKLLNLIRDGYAANDPFIMHHFEKPELVQPTRQIDPTTGKVSYVLSDYKNQPDSFITKVNGLEVYTKIKTPEMQVAINGFDGSTGKFISSIDKFSQTLESFTLLQLWSQQFHAKTIGLNPQFAVGLFFKQIGGTKINMIGLGAKFNTTDEALAKMATKEAYATMIGMTVKDPLVLAEIEELRSHGGHFNPIFDLASVENVNDQLAHLFSKSWTEGKSKKEMLFYFKDKALKLDSALTSFTNNVDMSNRLAIYRTMKANGASPKEAAWYAQNLPGNYAKKGTFSTTLSSLYPFYNAGVQGDNSMITAMLRGGLKKTIQLSAGLFALGVVNALWNYAIGATHKDEFGNNPYSLMPNYVTGGTRINWMVPGVNGEQGDEDYYIKLWKPWKIPSVIINAGGNTVRMMMGDMEPSHAAMLTLNDAISVNAHWTSTTTGDPISAMTPGFLRTAVELARNTDALGRPIHPTMPEAFEKKRANAAGEYKSQIHKKTTSEFSLTVADALHKTGVDAFEFYPDDLDYMIAAAAGAAGKFYGGIVESAYNLIPENRMAKEIKTGGREQDPLLDNPAVGMVVGKLKDQNINSRFQEVAGRVAEYKMKRQNAMADFDGELLNRIDVSHPKERMLLPYFDRVQSLIRSQRKQTKLIQENPNLTSEQKIVMLRDYSTRVVKAQQDFFAKWKQGTITHDNVE